MSNVLKVSHQEAIRGLHQKGWSQRRIARELGIHRQTVNRYSEGDSKCTSISIPGFGEESDSKCTTISNSGSESVVGREPAVSIAGRFGRKSWCEPFEAAINSKMGTGLSAQRIYQDLVEEKGFAGSYQSVCRFVRRLKQRQPMRVWRIECQPGEEMQVDFGLGAPIEQDDGKTRRSWVLRVVLSYSRKGYSEAVMRQDTESFLRCLENALRHFGGAPLLLNIDNLKAAVLKADWFDPQINPKLADFCRHYHIHVMPCRPRMPQHKGKVERGVSSTIHPTIMNNTLKQYAHTLRLSGLLSTLELRLKEAEASRLPYAQFLEIVFQDEINVREQRTIVRRHKAADFRELRSLDNFDFAFNPSIDRARLYELAACHFIRQQRDALLIGPPGVGKSHLAQAIGVEAIKAGFLVLYRSVFDLVRELSVEATQAGESRLLGKYLKPDLLIIDDMGLKILPPKSGEILLEIIMRRYENRSTLMTSNRPIEEWGKLLSDVPAASAILDRLLHHAEIIAITGRSYRLQDSVNQRTSPKPKSSPQHQPTNK